MMASLLRAAALLGFLGVALGAFGRHVLRRRLTEERTAYVQTAVQYHAVHVLAAIGTVLLVRTGAVAPVALAGGWMFLVGILLFSGSLYALAVTGRRWLGAVTPFGGLAFLLGWALLFVTVLHQVH